ncbi:MAG TPA: M3 family metallopeptidase [Microbacterium sp.]|nr:M3 family metallopeptidase [Microbacterium sp.]
MTASLLDLPADDAGWLEFVSARADARLAAARAALERLKDGSPRTTLEKLELWNDAEIAGSEVASATSLLSEVHPDAGIRAAAEERVEAVDALVAERNLDRDLWAVFADADREGLDDVAARLLDHILRDFRRGGVDLDDGARERVRELTARDTELGLAFGRAIRDGKREIRVAPEALAGLPADFVEAHPAGDDGLVVLTTEYTDLMPVREFATDRGTRTALLEAYNDLGWPDNDPVLAELLAVREERARLLGFTDWADFETETRMIGTGAAIPAFLDRLDEASRDAAAAEYERLLARLRRDVPDAEAVTSADYWFLMSALKREEYDVDAQRVRSYFRFDRVLAGVLETTGRLLDLQYAQVETSTWHEDVVSFDVLRGEERLGRIHLDLHPRDGKYNHAACFSLSPGVAGRSLPEGTLVCNFSRGLLEHDEVVTFFHEFGHLVHYILGGHLPWTRFSGFETEWDFVEAPSQLLEEWAWDPATLATFTANDDGEPIPADLVARMQRADAFGRALEVRRQLGYANVSYHLHVDRPADLQEATEALIEAATPIRPLRNAHTYAGFGHLTGYGACYYTYQWSLVIARDLLSGFGRDLADAEVALRYRTEILERGGSRDAADMVASFLGRPYAFDAYREWLAGS